MRSIDADALIKFIENRYDITWEDDYEGGIKDACTDILEEINKMPTIEPERKTGKWIIDDHDEYAVCDRCGEPCATYTLGKPRDRFCKWCGADMRGDKDEPL